MLLDRRWELDTVGRVLWVAADLMEEVGWCCGSATSPNGEVCMVVAISMARNIYEHDPKFAGNDSLQLACYERVRKQIGYRGGIAVWNDTVCCNEEQAVAALRGAALQEGERNALR
jgi:hypothetical protein